MKMLIHNKIESVGRRIFIRDALGILLYGGDLFVSEFHHFGILIPRFEVQSSLEFLHHFADSSLGFFIDARGLQGFEYRFNVTS